MATGTLTGQTIANTYKSLLKITGTTAGGETLHATNQTVIEDGDGNPFPFSAAQDALMITSTNRLEFGDTGTYIHQSADGVLDLVSDTEVEISGALIDINSTGAMTLDAAGSIDMNVVDGQTVAIGLNGGVETLWKPHGTAGSELWSTINTAGTTDGTDAAGSILLSAVAGGIGLAWADGKDLWAEGGRFVVTANEDAADAIKLHADAGTSQTITIVNDAGTGAAAIGLTASAGGITVGLGGGAGDDFIVDTNTLVVESDNNRVGIGTASPAQILDVRQAVNGSGAIISITNTDNSTSTDETCDIRTYFTTSGHTGARIRFGKDSGYGDSGDADSNIRFDTTKDNGNVEAMRINSDQQVGIGTADPDNLLEISHNNGSDAVTAANIADNSIIGIHIAMTGDNDADGSVLKFSSNGDGVNTAIAHIQKDGTNADLAFYTETAGALGEAVRIDHKNNVGIGTTVFSSGVSCLGLINGTDPGSATSNTACFFASSGEMNYTDASGNAATLDSLASDERMKDNIAIIPDALSRLANLKGITYNYVSYKDSSLPFKDKISDDVTFNSHNLYGNDTRAGVIAQDVEKAYDGLNITNAVMELTVESKSQGDMEDHVPEIYGKVKKVRVETLVPLLIEAVKELSAKVTALENA